MAYQGNSPAANFQSLPAVQRFNGTGSATEFTLASVVANDQSILVSVDGVTQDSNAYSVSGTTLTFTAAPSSGTGNILVHTISPVGSTVVPPDGIAINATTGTFSGAVSGSTISGSVTSGTTSTFTTTQAATNADILKLNATQTNSSSNLKFQINGGSTAQGQIRLGGNNDISIHNTSSDTEKLRILGAGGLTFNGDTAAANALDDYEEGTWTPSWTMDTGSVALTSDTKATYTKIGRTVTVNMYIKVASISSPSGACYVNGLPFVVTDNRQAAVATWAAGFSSGANGSVQSRTLGNESRFRVQKFLNGSDSPFANTIQVGTELSLSVTYNTA